MKKQLAILLIATGITACSQSGNSSAAQSSLPSPGAVDSTLSLGTLGTIPVGLNDSESVSNNNQLQAKSLVQNLDITGKLESSTGSGSNSGSVTYITIVNNLNKTANFQSIKVSGDSTVEENPGWYVNTTACQTVPAQSVCNIAINPPNKNGYFILTVNYDLGSSSQVVSYQKNIPANSGFIFNSNNNLVMTKNLAERSAFSVPVTFTQDMTSIKVSSNNPGFINTQLVCNGGSTVKNNVCTIMGLVQPGTPTGTSSITLSGVSLKSGEELTTTFPLLVQNTQNANLVTTGANVILNAAESVESSNVTILNNGNITATGITFSSNNSAINITQQGGGCSSLAPGVSCTITVSAHESQNFQATVTANYTGGVATSTSFNVVYIAQGASPGLSYTNTGNLLYTVLNESSNYSITVANNGSNTLSSIKPINLAAISSSLSYTTNGLATPCATDGSQSLSPGQNCQLQIHYAPTTVIESSSFNFTVIGNYVNGAGQTLSYSPGTINVQYSSIGSPALLVSNPNLWSFAIRANNTESTSESFVITNSGQQSTVINSISLTGSNMTLDNTKPLACTTSTTLNGESANSCKVYVNYGPRSVSESGIVNLQITYKPTPISTTNTTLSVPINYTASTAALINVSNIVSSGNTAAGGIGTSESALQFYNLPGTGNQLTTTITYSNTGTESAQNFNINLSNLPYSVALSNSSTCGTGSSTASLNANQSCTLVLQTVNTSIYNYLSITGQIVLPIPGFSYVDTQTGLNSVNAPFYNAVAGSSIYINANSFANVSSIGSTVVASTSSTNVAFTLPFVSTAGYSGAYPVTVALLNTGGAIFGSTTSCSISTPSSNCSISLTALAGLPAGNYNFQYSVTPTGGGGSVLNTVQIQVN